ncbi:MAG TPA: hypothetical protein VD861_03215, partial [Pyrinomonadaceae bacterium]|nr:hypothetical protein [Pyrinomonadaceae bacterium]
MTCNDFTAAIFRRTPRSSSHRTATSSRRMMGIGLALLTSLAAVAPASAQNIQYSQGSVGSTLNNTLQIPLRAYSGRGAASLPVTLYYSSAVWRIKYKNTIYNPYDVSLSEPMAEAKYAEYSAAGWTSSLGVPVLEWPEAIQVYGHTGKPVCLDCHNPPFSPGNYWKVPRLTVRMPDGSAHEL